VPSKNTVRWSTASEVDNFGYDVYRGEARDGPFERITPRPILGAGTSDETHRYVFVDETIDPCRTYYYVERRPEGVRERFTPAIRHRPLPTTSPPGPRRVAAPAALVTCGKRTSPRWSY
jgi:hypothetical protein